VLPKGSGINALILGPTQLTVFYINNCPTRCNTKCLFIILQVHSTCFGCQPLPSSGVHKTLTTSSGIVQLPPSKVTTWPRWREAAAQ